MYEDMTFENIMKSMLARCRDDVDRREGSIIYDATAAVAYHLVEMYFLLDNYLGLVFPDTSAGEFLDRFVAAFNIERKAATKAVREGRFNREIPEGSRFTTVGDVPLVFQTAGILSAEGGVYTYQMECETPGKDGNGYYGNLIPVEYISGLEMAELGAVLDSGADRETDASLRERFLARVRRPSTSGNVNDYYNWAMSVAGVGAARIFPLAEGPGTVKVVIASENRTAADESLISRAWDHIEEMRPIGATVKVVSATEKAVNISAGVRLSAGTNLGTAQEQFLEMADACLQANAFEARYISLARIGNLLLDVAGVEDYDGLLLNGRAENIVLQDEEIAVIGAVRLEVL